MRTELTQPDRRGAGGRDGGDAPREAGGEHEADVEGGLQPDHLRGAERDDAAQVDEEREHLREQHERVPPAHLDGDHEELGEDERRERDAHLARVKVQAQWLAAEEVGLAVEEVGLAVEVVGLAVEVVGLAVEVVPRWCVPRARSAPRRARCRPA